MGRAAHGEGAFDRTVMIDRPAPANAAEDALFGVTLGGSYVVRSVLGEGAMGRLYESTHLRIDRRFAIKVLHRELSRRDDLRARFEREARVMGRVRSDHVVDVVDVLTAPDGRTCIVTELLSGEDLEAHMAARGGRLPVQDAVFLARQCLWGLSAAHALAVVHRDIKPGNLFLSRDTGGRVTLKLLDFGIAKFGGDAEMTAASMVMGTPAYMPPEQARGAARADVRSDIYAVGAVLYRALTGRAPYVEEDVQTTLVRLLEDAPPRLSSLAAHVPLGLVAVVEQAMARDPAQRFGSADEFETALAIFDTGPSAALCASPVKAPDARPSDAAQRATLWARLVRPFAFCTLLALSLLAAATALLATSALTRVWSNADTLSTPERVLSAAAALLSLGFAMFYGGRALRHSYANAAEVAALSFRLRKGLLALSAGLGVWVVAGASSQLALHGAMVYALSPVSALAGLVALAGALAAALYRGKR